MDFDLRNLFLKFIRNGKIERVVIIDKVGKIVVCSVNFIFKDSDVKIINYVFFG